MFKRLLCSSFLWVLLLPWACVGLGAASNQAVLIANHDKFPVMVNAIKLKGMLAPKPKVSAEPFGDLDPGPTPEETKVDPDGMIDETHCVMTHYTHLNALADIFDLKEGIYSIGDFLIIRGSDLQDFCPYVFLALVVKKCWDAETV